MFGYIKSALEVESTVINTEVGSYGSAAIPEELKGWLEYVGEKNIYIPWSVEELIICGIKEIFTFQTGYSININRKKFHDWPEDHIVISSIMGDPICLNKQQQIVHAVHGVGVWNFDLVVNDLEKFDRAVASFIEVRKSTIGLRDGDELISPSERSALENEYKKFLSNVEIEGMFSIIDL
jgi:hypothetical protein